VQEKKEPGQGDLGEKGKWPKGDDVGKEGGDVGKKGGSGEIPREGDKPEQKPEKKY
jgi:hypothetical protein